MATGNFKISFLVSTALPIHLVNKLDLKMAMLSIRASGAVAIKYVTLHFLMISSTPPPHCHKLSHRGGPPESICHTSEQKAYFQGQPIEENWRS